jgi:hypothetical protein
MQALRGTGHVVFGQQGIERDQQIEVEASQDIVHGNTWHVGNPFSTWPGETYRAVHLLPPAPRGIDPP